MRIIYFGSGAFGLPTFKLLAKRHDVALVVTQPDRPAGRRRKPTATPIARYAEQKSIEVARPLHVDDPDVVQMMRAVPADAFVVIAYGQKLGRALLEDRFAINLHGSLLPKYRGAAPVNWAIINGEKVTGLSVITLADRMDAGGILGQVETPIDPHETAGELHDRLADLGPELVSAVLSRYEDGSLTRREQDESEVIWAPRLRKEDGTVSFDQPAARVRARVHGLTPWPGCRVLLGDQTLHLHRVSVESDETRDEEPGTIVDDSCVICAPGVVRLLSVQPPGGKLMSFDAFRRGRSIDEQAKLRAYTVEKAST